MSPSQITTWKTDGTFLFYDPADSDDDRGEKLKAAILGASSGDAVVVGPGNYKRKVT